MTSLSSTNREKFQKIERSDRLLHPEDRKRQSLARLFSNWDKKKHTHTQKQSLIRLLPAFHSENLVGKFEIHMIMLSLYSIYLSTSLHLSEVSGIFDLFADLSLSKWKCYVIWHIQKNENCQDNCPSRLSGQLSCHYEKINTQSQWWTTFSMLFSRADLRESMVFYDLFSRPMFAWMF